MKQRLIIVISALFVFLCLTPTLLQAAAGTSGKISGIVEDDETGEPIIGATIRVEGQDVATSTDEDGEYFVIGLPIGKYNVMVTHVGFETNTREEVRVLVDLTTPVNFSIKPSTLDLGREVIVRATAQVIQPDLTASRSIFTAERLASLPNTIDVQAVLTNYPGVVLGKQTDMHIRGGRADQVAYYLDGFSVVDPFTSMAGMRIMPSALEELSLMTGGFTAEYGNALSGIVNAVTREGGANYRGRVRAYEGFTKPYNVETGTMGDMERIANRSAAFDLSGPIPGLNPQKYTFFAAGEYLRNNTYLPHNWEISHTGLIKLVMKPLPNLRLKTNIEYNRSFGDLYEHRDQNGRSYDFNLDGLPAFEKENYLVGISGNYAVSEKLIVSLGLNRFSTQTLQAPRHLLGTHWSQWPGYSVDSLGVYNGTIQDSNYLPSRSDPYHVTGFTTGSDFDPTYKNREAAYNAISASIEAQTNKSNQIKAGFEFKRWSIFRDSKQFYNVSPYTEYYASNPKNATIYVQDKIEHHDFVLNVGMRFDYRDNDIRYNLTARDALLQTQKANPGDPDTYVDTEVKTNWSPRLGMSFPISEKSVMHFNYGVYYQVPQYRHMFFNLAGEVSSGLPILGNPDLEPERTVAYELGLDHLIGSSLRVDITAFYKDISDLVTTVSDQSVGIDPVTLYQNGDYGSVEGFDIAIEKLSGDGIFSGSVSYTYMTTTGNSNTAEDAYYQWITNPDESAPVSEYPLDFDQRHTVTAVLDWRIPRQWDGRLFGMKLPTAWGVSMVGSYGSGLPYTKTDASGNRLGQRNEGRLPVTYSVDMRINKNFHFADKSQYLTFFLEVDNLFDRRNVVNVYSRTGLPDDDAFGFNGGLALNQSLLDRLDNLYDNDPQNYSPPRTIRTGLEFNF